MCACYSWVGSGGGGGVIKFGFGRDVPPWHLKVDPHKHQFFKKSEPFIYQSAQVWAKFWAKSPDFSKIIISKNQPIHITNFAIFKGSFIFQEADFATHVGSTSLKDLLYWVPTNSGILSSNSVALQAITEVGCPYKHVYKHFCQMWCD